MPSRTPGGTDERVTILEGRLESLGGTVTDIRQDVATLDHKIDSILTMVSSSRQLSGPIVMQFLTVVVSVIGGIVVLGGMALSPIRENISRLEKNTENPHPASLSQFNEMHRNFDDMKTRLEKQDEDIQREMRDLISGDVDRLSAEIAALDRRLQMEMRDRDEVNYWKRRAEEDERSLLERGGFLGGSGPPSARD